MTGSWHGSALNKLVRFFRSECVYKGTYHGSNELKSSDGGLFGNRVGSVTFELLQSAINGLAVIDIAL